MFLKCLHSCRRRRRVPEIERKQNRNGYFFWNSFKNYMARALINFNTIKTTKPIASSYREFAQYAFFVRKLLIRRNLNTSKQNSQYPCSSTEHKFFHIVIISTRNMLSAYSRPLDNGLHNYDACSGCGVVAVLTKLEEEKLQWKYHS